jgi:hypothetical protein
VLRGSHCPSPPSAPRLATPTCLALAGEIIPSAIFTGPNQLRIAAALSPLVYGLIAVASPIAYPLACLLDRVLGDSHSETQFKRQELRAIMKMATEDITRGAPLPQALRVHNASPRSSGGRQHDVRAQPSHRPSVLVSQTEDGHQVGRWRAARPHRARVPGSLALTSRLRRSRPSPRPFRLSPPSRPAVRRRRRRAAPPPRRRHRLPARPPSWTRAPVPASRAVHRRCRLR